MAVYVDPARSPESIRGLLYGGDVVLLTGLPAVLELVERTRRSLGELFGPLDPEHVHDAHDAAELAALLGDWKPRFIRDPEINELTRRIVVEAGFAPATTHYDMPKPRTSFPVGHLTTGVAYAFPWHRDVWYAAPAQQINWWLPIFPVVPENAMSFDLDRFARPVPNDSASFDYYQLNAVRNDTAKQVTAEVQSRPQAATHETGGELVLLPEPGQVMLFSGAQLHRSIPNTSGLSRYSIDFRTVDVDDLVAGRGAPLVDADCTGTAIRDFLNVADGRTFPERLVTDLFGPAPADAVLVFEPDGPTLAIGA